MWRTDEQHGVFSIIIGNGSRSYQPVEGKAFRKASLPEIADGKIAEFTGHIYEKQKLEDIVKLYIAPRVEKEILPTLAEMRKGSFKSLGKLCYLSYVWSSFS